MSFITKVYQSSPYQLKQGAKWVYTLLPIHLRYKRDFFKMSAWLEQSQWWSLEKLEEYQNERLRVLIQHVYNNVPYYHRLFRRLGLSPSDIKTIQDLPKIPILTKEVLRNQSRDLLANNFDEKALVYLSTSGTTGQPVGIYSEKRLEYSDGDPFWRRHYQWGGCSLTDRIAKLTASTIQPKINGTRRLFSYNPVRNLLILSAYDLNRKNIGQYAIALDKYQPEFINGFPSALETMVRYFKDNSISKPVHLKAIFTQSEMLYPWQRNLIENYFGCEIYDWYGMEERVVCASECEKHAGHHLFSEFSIVEFIKDGKPVVGEEGEIIATRLDNYAMPLIRYCTRDIGVQLQKKCDCGRNLPLMKIVGGRDRNFAVTKTGGLISVTIIDVPKSGNIEQFQFVQEEKGVMTLRIVKKEIFSEDDLKLINKNLFEKFGDMMAVRIEFVDKISLTARGKLPLLIQRLNIDEN